MTINQGLFSSNTDQWATPQNFFNELNKIFHFEIDVCADSDNAKCEKYFTEEMDGLKQEWKGICWMNPPYGREIGRWTSKANESYKNGATVVCLLPARTDTKYMQEHVFANAKYVGFVKGRLKFGDGNGSAPFPSLVAVFTDNDYDVDDINIKCKWVKLK